MVKRMNRPTRRAIPSRPAGPSPVAPPKETAAPAAKQDVVLLGPPTADGNGVHVLRAREERLEAGELRALEEGRPVTGEVVSLRPREDNPRICDVADSYTPPTAAKAAAAARKGPAQVATDKYRDGWDEIFANRSGAPGDRRTLN